MCIRPPVTLIAGLALVVQAFAAPAPVDFIHDVRPILEKHCTSCHGPEKHKSGFRLDVKAEALRGGDSGEPAILPGKGAESPLIRFVSGLDEDMLMPSKGERLNAGEIDTLKRWIDEGAAWPDGVDTAVAVDKLEHWSFKPLRRDPVPPSTSGHPIDGFIAAKLAENGLTLSPEADRRTLIRRLHLILHGLPPAPEEAEAFVAIRDPGAYEALVDRLLASPRYGERWARHWLDVIAFAETHGFEVNTPRENAWPYRDYVIEAFNRDTPYPRFILEQLAGDTVNEPRGTAFLVATAALLTGQIGKDEESKLKARQDELNDMVANVGGAFLGLTLHCARCHDHKFDPVSQKDYYSLQAVFAGVRHGERPIPPSDWDDRQKREPALRTQFAVATERMFAFEPVADVATAAPTTPRRAALQATVNSDRFAPVTTNRVRFTVSATLHGSVEAPCIDELEVFSVAPDRRNVALASAGARVTASGSDAMAMHAPELINDGVYGDEQAWLSNEPGKGWIEIEFARPERIDFVKWGRDRLGKYRDRLPTEYRIEVAGADGVWRPVATSADRAPTKDGAPPRSTRLAHLKGAELAAWAEANGEFTTLERQLRELTQPPKVYAGRFEKPPAVHVLSRGDPMQPREAVAPRALSQVGPALTLPADASESQRRVALAHWLADPENPLPARVLVNRIWQHHFGEGLVGTPNDFGRNGALPTHPELLDWLARDFIAGGWSIKRLQREIVLSATWRQSSAPRPDALAKDAGTRLLWRFPPRRIEAEGVRDSTLAVSGKLDLRMGGPGFLPFAPNFNYVRVYEPKLSFGPDDWRRMIYMTKVRMAQDSTFGAFDCPDAGQSAPKRPRSTTPLQALSLFNSRFVLEQAGFMGERLQRESADSPAAQVRRAFALAFQRAPDAAELVTCEKLIREHGLSAFCRVLLNANELLFIP
ncbi:MAG: PSD1 and planctomycete cytochrome C domain-containing protein [Opitutaceae bacterium]|nr:PSD1 and planctomycete cytochrome C domain-containing protein [Opitutaceae bacterium]